MFNDLLFGSVDAMIKTADAEDDLYHDQCQTFILAKLPAILSFIATSAFDSFASEDALLNSWNILSTSTIANSLSTGRRFLHICTFHHLLTSESIANIISEETNLSKGLYAKDDLITQVAANHTRGPRLVDELLKKDGNANNISQAIMEVNAPLMCLQITDNIRSCITIVM